MAVLLQTVVARFLDWLVGSYGPFVIPVLLFAAGAVGYLVLVAAGRAGIAEDLVETSADEVGWGESPPDSPNDGDEEWQR
jgi:hypothetical protein